MSQSLAKNTIHLIFSTKNRHPWLKETVQARLQAYLAGIFKQWESPAIVIGGLPGPAATQVKPPSSLIVSVILAF